MWKELISRLTMKREEYLFTDKINGKEVFRWTDKYGQSFMAQSKFGVRVNQSK